MADLQILGCQTCPWYRARTKDLCQHPHRVPDEGVYIRALLEGCPLQTGPTTVSLLVRGPVEPATAAQDQVDPYKAVVRMLTTTDRCTRMGESWVLWSLDGPRRRTLGCMTDRQVEGMAQARLLVVDGDVLRPGPVAHDLQARGGQRLQAAVRRALGVRR